MLAAFGLGVSGKFLEVMMGAVLAKILLLGLIILFIQRRPQGLFAVKGRFWSNNDDHLECFEVICGQ